MTPPRSVKKVQLLIGRLVALNKFISCIGKCSMPLFRTLKNISNFEWTPKCQKSFEGLKACLLSPRVLSHPWENEDLFLYLGLTNLVVNDMQVREENGFQCLVYYSSKTLHDAKTRYLNVEKVTLTLVIASRKLRSYFQAHQIITLTYQPLWQILHKPDTLEHLVRWTIELWQFGL
jgi:hypothetical protein